MKVLEAPTGKPTEKIVFWFLQWHRAAYGKPFKFRYQTELAAAAGVSNRAISDLIEAKNSGKEHLKWFIFNGTSADVADTSEL